MHVPTNRQLRPRAAINAINVIVSSTDSEEDVVNSTDTQCDKCRENCDENIIQCSKCHKFFHYVCCNPMPSAYYKANPKNWKCMACKPSTQ